MNDATLYSLSLSDGEIKFIRSDTFPPAVDDKMWF